MTLPSRISSAERVGWNPGGAAARPPIVLGSHDPLLDWAIRQSRCGLATFFALRNNPVEGAFEARLLEGTGKVAVAVLVPLLSGFFFAARTAAGVSGLTTIRCEIASISSACSLALVPCWEPASSMVCECRAWLPVHLARVPKQNAAS